MAWSHVVSMACPGRLRCRICRRGKAMAFVVTTPYAQRFGGAWGGRKRVKEVRSHRAACGDCVDRVLRDHPGCEDLRATAAPSTRRQEAFL